MQKLIINAAITGMVPTKDSNPYVPISVQEIIAEIKRCRDAGASIIHVHARKPNGTPAYEREIYADIIRGARAECPDILLSASTSGRAFKEFWQRSQALDPAAGVRPDFGSLTLGSMNFPTQASVNPPEMVQALAKKMNELGIVPEWECFELGMINYAHYLIEKGILKRPYYCNLLLGSLGSISATPHNLITMINALPEGTVWSVAGIGRLQFAMNSLAIVMGGHVRAGLEDNLFYDAEKTQPATNAGLIERLVKLAHAAGREIASPDETRQIIGLKQSAQSSREAPSAEITFAHPDNTVHLHR